MSPGAVYVGPEWIDEEEARRYLQYFNKFDYFVCPEEEVRFIDGKMLCGDILCERYRERDDNGKKIYECGCRVIRIGYDCEYVPGWWEDYCHKQIEVRDCAFAEVECDNNGECRIKRVKRRPPGGCICTGTCNCGVVG
jgi:hypothetical protein